VFLTGRSTAGLKEVALKGGAVDFIDKTDGIPNLIERLLALLETFKVMSRRRPPGAWAPENGQHPDLRRLSVRATRVRSATGRGVMIARRC
jgi:FixJ family two-component response regulator